MQRKRVDILVGNVIGDQELIGSLYLTVEEYNQLGLRTLSHVIATSRTTGEQINSIATLMESMDRGQLGHGFYD